MEEYVKEAKEVSLDEEIIGLYDKGAHQEMLRLTELKNVKEEGMKNERLKIANNMLKKGRCYRFCI